MRFSTSSVALVVMQAMMAPSLLRAFVPAGRRAATARFMSATAEEAPAAASQEEESKPFKYDFSMEDVVSLCKRRGIIFPSSEIYNGYAGFYDYGPLGSELKKNVKDAWWKYFVTQREDVVGLDSSIIHNPTTWKSSGKQMCSFVKSTFLRKPQDDYH